MEKFVCIKELIEEMYKTCHYGVTYFVYEKDLTSIRRESMYILSVNEEFVRTIFNVDILKEYFLPYNEWVAIERERKIDEILQD